MASADVSSHVPNLALLPVAAALCQSEGQVTSASTVPESAEAQEAGAEPDLIFNRAEVPIVVSIESSTALRTATESCIGFSDKMGRARI